MNKKQASEEVYVLLEDPSVPAGAKEADHSG